MTSEVREPPRFFLRDAFFLADVKMDGKKIAPEPSEILDHVGCDEILRIIHRSKCKDIKESTYLQNLFSAKEVRDRSVLLDRKEFATLLFMKEYANHFSINHKKSSQVWRQIALWIYPLLTSAVICVLAGVFLSTLFLCITILFSIALCIFIYAYIVFGKIFFLECSEHAIKFSHKYINYFKNIDDEDFNNLIREKINIATKGTSLTNG
jgi:hypothetical protein